jgi:nucleoside-diphosphate-sugar epimerase
MKVLVTGANGFFGSALVKHLTGQDCETYAMVRANSDLWRMTEFMDQITLVQADLLRPDQVEQVIQEVKPDLCFHLAWYVEPGVYLHSTRNVEYVTASLNLAEQLARAGCRRLVVTGSVNEYDTDRGYLSENTPTKPTNFYAASKVALHTLLEQLSPQIDLEAAWARVFYVYGPKENEGRFFPAIITALLQGEHTRTTGGEQVRDYLHIDDAAGALWALAESDLTGVVNVGSGVPVTNKQVVLAIADVLGRHDLVRFGDLPYREGDPMFVVADNRLLHGQTGWQPRYDLREGLADTIDWWRQHALGD